VIEAANPEMKRWRSRSRCVKARELDKSAALVTPDRALARRVEAALGRWSLQFDDSGGDALTDTAAGIFAPAGRGNRVKARSRRRCWRC